MKEVTKNVQKVKLIVEIKVKLEEGGKIDFIERLNTKK